MRLIWIILDMGPNWEIVHYTDEKKLKKRPGPRVRQ
jgi:hypothetical protein